MRHPAFVGERRKNNRRSFDCGRFAAFAQDDNFVWELAGAVFIHATKTPDGWGTGLFRFEHRLALLTLLL
jgi:hypothetical protein